MFPPPILALRAPIPLPPPPPRGPFARDAAFITPAVTATIAIADDPFAQAAATIAPYIAISPTAPAATNDNSEAPPGGGTASAFDGGDGECRLLGPFALLVQLALGALALLALVYKRWRERPQRPVKIWFFDASKQVFGSALVHVANVFMSMLTSGRFSIKLVPPQAVGHVEILRRAMGVVLMAREEAAQEYVPNPCSFYLLNLGIDTTLGIPILIFLVRLTTRLVAKTPFGQPAESIKSGNYGHPPRAWWWLKQSVIYFFGLMGMKVLVLVLFMLFPWIARVGDWALRWTEGDEQLQIVFVMMLFPLIMNALQYYIIDSFIKMKENGGGDAGHADSAATASADHGGAAYQELVASSESDDDEEGEDRKASRQEQQPQREQGGSRQQPASARQSEGSDANMPRRRSIALRSPTELEYDPAVDGEMRTETVQSSGSSSTTGSHPVGQRTIQKELYPKE